MRKITALLCLVLYLVVPAFAETDKVVTTEECKALQCEELMDFMIKNPTCMLATDFCNNGSRIGSKSPGVTLSGCSHRYVEVKCLKWNEN
jgi:hypothetical protein